jgi:hypothetical protein
MKFLLLFLLVGTTYADDAHDWYQRYVLDTPAFPANANKAQQAWYAELHNWFVTHPFPKSDKQ